MGGLKRTYRALTALSLAALGTAATAIGNAPRAGAAGIFGAEPLAEGSTVALAQSVDGNRWNLVVVERLQPGSGCWQQQANGLVSLEPGALSNEALCNRLQSSSGYSLRAGGQDLRAPGACGSKPTATAWSSRPSTQACRHRSRSAPQLSRSGLMLQPCRRSPLTQAGTSRSAATRGACSATCT